MKGALVDGPHKEICGLRKSERRLLPYLCAGLTEVQIAEEMGLSRRTVHSVTDRILSKFYARTRTQVAVYALMRGLVKESEVLEIWRAFAPHLEST